MNACWSAVYDAASAASLLGALPLDVYRLIFRALDYATLRDACRVLNSVLGPVAQQTLDAMRYALAATDAVPISCAMPIAALRQRLFVPSTHVAHGSTQHTGFVYILDMCGLPLGGFLLVLHVHDAGRFQYALASFSAHAKLERVLPVQWPAEQLQLDAYSVQVRFVYAHDRRVYIMLEYDAPVRGAVLVRYALDANEPVQVRVVPRTLARDVPHEGPARWTELSVASCAVATTEPLRLVLCCNGVQTAPLLDQVVLLEMDADLNTTRALTLCTPDDNNLQPDAPAPWPSSGHFSGVTAQFCVDTHGRYVFRAAQVGAGGAALLLFEPQHGALVTCVWLDACEPHVTDRDAALYFVHTAAPHENIYLSFYGSDRIVQVFDAVNGTPPRISHVTYMELDHSAPLLLDDGYLLNWDYSVEHILMLHKKPLYALHMALVHGATSTLRDAR